MGFCTKYEKKLTSFIQNSSKIGNSMNCNKISEAHVWRYSKHTKMRRCLKCKSRIAITAEEFAQKWGMHKKSKSV
ncbi:MAG: hypothetical protein HQ505_06210 [Nitrosopumilus sp.]|nr:hypothetical protein [Nitrosopumilus sp.]